MKDLNTLLPMEIALQDSMRDVVKEVLDSIRLLASEGMTMLIVSHEMSFVKEVSSRVVFMDEGSIIEVNNPKNIFEKPKEKRTLDFVGKILKEK